MPRQKADKPARDDQAVKVERAIVEKARVIVLARKQTGRDPDLTLAEYLSDLLRAAVDRDHHEALAQLGASDSAPKPGRKGSGKTT
jgi:electron transfer flavoprotein alpha subunit